MRMRWLWLQATRYSFAATTARCIGLELFLRYGASMQVLGETEKFQLDLSALRDAALDTTPVSIGNRRTNSPHEFYRYPARFPPSIVAASLNAFTNPGDVVADYFVGGGTTLVECRLAGRVGIGADINPLATFVSRVKTRLYSGTELRSVENWATNSLKLGRGTGFDFEGIEHVTDPRWAHLVDDVGTALKSLAHIDESRARDLARCSLLRAAQWALDMRGEIPSSTNFKEVIATVAHQTAAAAAESTRRYRAADRANPAGLPARTIILDAGLPDLSTHAALAETPAPRLVLTSPPYPRVYMNYHHWKLQGRLETSLPYAIADLPMPRGRAHYTMSARSDMTGDLYFAKLREAFRDISRMIDEHTWIVQIVGFSDVGTQLPRYLEAMRSAGLQESTFSEAATSDDGRLWRRVPRRRWWARAGDRSAIAEGTAQEVVLFHQRDSALTATPPVSQVCQLSAA